MLKFGIEDGLIVTVLTWAFFVLCTPIADAGFIVDFPVRMLFGIKMIKSELIVWSLAISITVLSLIFAQNIFEQIELLALFYNILTNPWPFWGIIILSAIGSFLSINLGDNIINLVQQKRHHHKLKKLQLKRLLIELSLFIVVLSIYFILLKMMHITI